MSTTQDHELDHGHDHGYDHQHAHRHDHRAPHNHDGFEATDAEWAAFNALEGEVLAGIVDDSLKHLAGVLETDGIDVGRVIDLGCGAGVATGTLAQTFPTATVDAIDSSVEMLARAIGRVAGLGVSPRVRAILADLPGDLDHLEGADLVWMSMVLHHIGDEAATLAAISRLLPARGLLALVEFGDETRMFPPGSPDVPLGFEDRITAAGSKWVADMRDGLPGTTSSDDYPTMLRAAGFEMVVDEMVGVHFDSPLDGPVRTVLRGQLEQMRQRWAADLEPADIRFIEELVGDGPDSVMQRNDIAFHSFRHLYIARTVAAPDTAGGPSR